MNVHELSAVETAPGHERHEVDTGVKVEHKNAPAVVKGLLTHQVRNE